MFSNFISFHSAAYKGSVSDVLNRGTASGYNEMIDIEQEGLENSLIFKSKKQKLALTNTLSKSREEMEDLSSEGQRGNLVLIILKN